MSDKFDLKKIHVVVNPAAGKNESILNTMNQVFGENKVEWEVSVTHKFGDATEQAKKAAERGVDAVGAYGGDGTQHEVAIGVMGTDVPLAVLPGGTGNGFAVEIGVEKKLEAALKQLCDAKKVRKIDVAKMGDEYFIQRLFTGIEPEDQTSREDKDKYGSFAYVMRGFKLAKKTHDVEYEVDIDGEVYSLMGSKLYVVNSATSGSGLSLGTDFAVDDGLLDVFMLSEDLKSLTGAAERMFNIKGKNANLYYKSGKKITIKPKESQPVWIDGEFFGRTPVTVEVLEHALNVVDVR